VQLAALHCCAFAWFNRHPLVRAKLTTIGASATKATLKISQKVRPNRGLLGNRVCAITPSWGPLTVFAADIISTVEFDQTGNYLATGDKGGRVVLFERNETVCGFTYI